MSASTDSLKSAVEALATEVTAVAVAVASLKAGQSDPADVAAVDKATADVQVAVEALKSAVA